MAPASPGLAPGLAAGLALAGLAPLAWFLGLPPGAPQTAALLLLAAALLFAAAAGLAPGWAPSPAFGGAALLGVAGVLVLLALDNVLTGGGTPYSWAGVGAFALGALGLARAGTAARTGAPAAAGLALAAASGLAWLAIDLAFGGTAYLAGDGAFALGLGLAAAGARPAGGVGAPGPSGTR